MNQNKVWCLSWQNTCSVFISKALSRLRCCSILFHFIYINANQSKQLIHIMNARQSFKKPNCVIGKVVTWEMSIFIDFEQTKRKINLWNITRYMWYYWLSRFCIIFLLPYTFFSHLFDIFMCLCGGSCLTWNTTISWHRLNHHHTQLEYQKIQEQKPEHITYCQQYKNFLMLHIKTYAMCGFLRTFVSTAHSIDG